MHSSTSARTSFPRASSMLLLACGFGVVDDDDDDERDCDDNGSVGFSEKGAPIIRMPMVAAAAITGRIQILNKRACKVKRTAKPAATRPRAKEAIKR
mmetsp:Transcript_1547/g.3280  ORF Transcript_1547/g.3280 Transcript_1547/m.3280 type:complete len:97 (+) Transcript_1547:574-864(+)